MSLTDALSAARSSLSATALQTAVVARNVTGANEPFYARKNAEIAAFGGGVRVTGISRASEPALMRTLLTASSKAAGSAALAEGLTDLARTVGDPENGQSPAALLGTFRDTLQQLSSSPEDPVLAQAVLNAAQDTTRSLNEATELVQGIRERADADMAIGVEQVNLLLAQLEPINAQIVFGTQAGDDVTRLLDERDQIVADLAQLIGLRLQKAENNDLLLFTDSGVTLFETTARAVSFEATIAFDATTVGNAILVDGVPVIGPAPTMPVTTGRLAGLAELRDEVAPRYQSQLDEIARGLIETFAESDQSATPSQPDIPGLFTWPGAPAMPPAATIVTGLAGTIEVNSNADPSAGGDLDRIRDGGIGDPGNAAYVYNSSGASGFSGRIDELIDAMADTRSFDPNAGADPSNSLLGFASSSVSWIEANRKQTSATSDFEITLRDRTAEALSNATGVNIDEEMTVMLELERAYQASARLVSTIDTLFEELLAAVR